MVVFTDFCPCYKIISHVVFGPADNTYKVAFIYVAPPHPTPPSPHPHPHIVPQKAPLGWCHIHPPAISKSSLLRSDPAFLCCQSIVETLQGKSLLSIPGPCV